MCLDVLKCWGLDVLKRKGLIFGFWFLLFTNRFKLKQTRQTSETSRTCGLFAQSNKSQLTIKLVVRSECFLQLPISTENQPKHST